MWKPPAAFTLITASNLAERPCLAQMPILKPVTMAGRMTNHAMLWLVRPVLLIYILEHMDREWCSVPQKEKWTLDGHVSQVWRKCQLLSHVILFASPWTIAHQIPLSMGFPRQECWSGLPLPSLEDLPDPQIEPGSPAFRQILYHLSYDRMDWKMCPGIIIWQSR